MLGNRQLVLFTILVVKLFSSSLQRIHHPVHPVSQTAGFGHRLSNQSTEKVPDVAHEMRREWKSFTKPMHSLILLRVVS
jgi:hypothetical protein